MKDLYDKKKPLVLFDGVCNLCEGVVKFLISRDSKSQIQFSQLQSETSEKILNIINARLKYNLLDTLIVVDKGIAYEKSQAFFIIVKYLDGYWKYLKILNVFPLFFKNFVYDLIARNRYKIFGKKDTCLVPSDELKNRFIDNTF